MWPNGQEIGSKANTKHLHSLEIHPGIRTTLGIEMIIDQPSAPPRTGMQSSVWSTMPGKDNSLISQPLENDANKRMLELCQVGDAQIAVRCMRHMA